MAAKVPRGKGLKRVKGTSAKASTASRATSLTKGLLSIRYSDLTDLQDKLLSAAQSVSRLNIHHRLATEAGSAPKDGAVSRISSSAIPDTLGPQLAYQIVTTCANETDLTKKLSEIPALDPVIFAGCIQTSVATAGYNCAPFSSAPSTTLWAVVLAIQTSSK